MATTKVPKMVACECAMTKSLKWVNSCMRRSASTEPWKQPVKKKNTTNKKNKTTKTTTTKKPKNTNQQPSAVPQKMVITAHTGTISSMLHTMETVWVM